MKTQELDKLETKLEALEKAIRAHRGAYLPGVALGIRRAKALQKIKRFHELVEEMKQISSRLPDVEAFTKKPQPKAKKAEQKPAKPAVTKQKVKLGEKPKKKG